MFGCMNYTLGCIIMLLYIYIYIYYMYKTKFYTPDGATNSARPVITLGWSSLLRSARRLRLCLPQWNVRGSDGRHGNVGYMYVYIYIINTLGIYTLHDMKGDGHTFYKKPWKFTSRWKFPQNGGPPKNDPSHSTMVTGDDQGWTAWPTSWAGVQLTLSGIPRIFHNGHRMMMGTVMVMGTWFSDPDGFCVSQSSHESRV